MGSDEHEIRTRAHSVAVIGAGPSGIAAAKYLLAEAAFEDITIFEQRSDIGGLWIYTPCPPSVLADLQVPQTDAHQPSETPLQADDDEVTYLSPVYDRLETNIPRGLMGFSDLDWPRRCQLFPPHDAVLDYIQEYGKDVRHLVKFNTQVLDVGLASGDQWQVTTQSTSPKASSQQEEHLFDAVIVANGHFRVEYIPPMPGLEQWHAQHPHSIWHSKLYRRPEDFAGKKVVIVGNSASGIDIGAQIKRFCKKPMIQCSRSRSYLQTEPPPDQTEKPEIERLDAQTRTVVFEDGTQECDVDAIVFCTGYMYNYPFLESLKPEVTSTGERVQHLYKHLFYYPHPTLSFLVINQKVIPFPVAEAQAAVVARFLSGRLALPSQKAMERWEQDQLARTERLRDFHLLKFPKDADYINELHDWALSADVAVETGKASGHSVGKEPPCWTELEYWTRERFPDIKRAFNSFGEDRHAKTSLQQVGFDYGAWKAEQVALDS